MKIKQNEKLITELLEEISYVRDCDILLYYELLNQKLGINTDEITATDLLKMIRSKKAPHWESVSRCRRDIQSTVEQEFNNGDSTRYHMMGSKRKAKLAEEIKVKNELGYARIY